MKYIGLLLSIGLIATAAEPNLFYKVNRSAWEEGWLAGAKSGTEITLRSIRINAAPSRTELTERLESDWQAYMTNTTAKLGTNYFK